MPLTIPIVPCHSRRQKTFYTPYLTSQPKATSESRHRHDAGNSRAGQCYHMEHSSLELISRSVAMCYSSGLIGLRQAARQAS